MIESQLRNISAQLRHLQLIEHTVSGHITRVTSAFTLAKNETAIMSDLFLVSS